MDTFTIDSNTILQLGVGFAIVYVVLRLVFNLLEPILAKVLGTSKINGSAQLSAELQAARSEMALVKRQIEDLHMWHDARTEDGGFRWYVPSTLERAIEALALNVSRQTDVLREVANFQRDTCNVLERLERKVEEVGR